MTVVEGDEMQTLWSLIADLSNQLSNNRQLCENLQAQARELKGQAHHNTTGFSLRRFNVDISKEKFESTLEATNAQLVIENQNLAHENKQLNALLKEYENTLETVMAKFRSFSHATQSHTLALTSHYDSLLSSNSHAAASSSLHASTALSNTLSHLGALIRSALRDAQGEGESDEEDYQEGDGADERGDDDQDQDQGIEDPFQDGGYRVGSPSGVGPSSRRNKKIDTHANANQRYKGYGSSQKADPRWYGTGGYTGKNGDPESEKADRALERLTEMERLENENEMLRKLLEIKEENEKQVDIARDLLSKGIMNPATTAMVSPGLSLGSPRNRSGGITSRNNSLGSSVESLGGGALGLNAGNPAPSSNEDPSTSSNELSVVSNGGHHYAPATSPRATLPTVSLPKPRRDSSSSSGVGLPRRSSLSPTNKPLTGSTPLSPTSLLPPPPPKPPAVDVDKVMVEPPSVPNEDEEDEEEEEASNYNHDDESQLNDNDNEENSIIGLPSNSSPSRKNIYSGRNSNNIRQKGGVGMIRSSQDSNFSFENGQTGKDVSLEDDEETTPYQLNDDYHPPGLGISSPSRNSTLELQNEANGFEGLGLSNSTSIEPLGNETSNYDPESLPPPPVPAGASSPPLISQEEATATAQAQQEEAKLALNNNGGRSEESDSSSDGNSDSSESSSNSSNTTTSSSSSPDNEKASIPLNSTATSSFNDEDQPSSSSQGQNEERPIDLSVHSNSASTEIDPTMESIQDPLLPPKAPSSTPLELEDEDELPPPPPASNVASKSDPGTINKGEDLSYAQVLKEGETNGEQEVETD